MKIRIKETALKNKGWSLYRLACNMGLPQQTVYSWAKGKSQPNWDAIDRLCSYLDCSIGDLFQHDSVDAPMYRTFRAKEITRQESRLQTEGERL